MAILDLQAGQEKVIKDLICKSNPQLLEYPDYYFRPLGDLVDHGDGTVSVFLLGDPADVETQQVSGKVFARYSRVDLTKYFQGIQHKIQLSNPRDVKQLLWHLGEQFGIVIPESLVVNVALAPTASGSVLVQLTTQPNRNYVFNQTEYTLEWEPAPLVHLYDVLTVSRLPVTPAVVTLDWAELSSDWFVTDDQTALRTFAESLVVGQPFDGAQLAALVTNASQSDFGTWMYAAEGSGRNLYGAEIAANNIGEYSAGIHDANRCLVITPVDLHTGGVGQITVYYNSLT